MTKIANDTCEEETKASSSRDADNQDTAPLHHHSNPRDDDDDHKNNSHPFRIKSWLISLVVGSRSRANGNGRNDSQNNHKRKLIAFALAAVLVAALLRFSRGQRHRRITASSSSSSSSSLSTTSSSIVDILWPLGVLIGWWKGPEYKRSPQESTMSLLWNAAKDGVIQRALIGSHSIFFQTKRLPPPSNGNNNTTGTGTTTTTTTPSLQWNRALLPPNNESIKTGILEALAEGGCTDIAAIPESIWSKLTGPVLAALPFVYLALLYRMMKNQFGGEDFSSKSTNGTHKLWGDEERDRTTFRDVAGLDSVIEDMSEVVSYLANPTLYKTMGARPPRGVLLHGPPGSGKTLLARAVAGEAMCDSFTALSGSAFVEMYVGRGAARVRSLFAKARRDAIQRQKLKRAVSWWSNLFGGLYNYQSTETTGTAAAAASLQRPPCAILFIDELDAVAKARSSADSIHGGNDEREQTLNQLLTDMDGFDTGNGDGRHSNRSRSSGSRIGREREQDVTLIVIAASNRVDVIDEAVLRRFDRQIFVGYPNAQGRKEILLVHAKKIHCSTNSIDWDQLASSEYTDNFSGADLRNVINEAALYAIREKSPVVEHAHLIHAARRIGQMKNRTTSRVGAPSLPMFFTSID